MGFTDLVAAADRAAQGLLGGVAVIYQPEVGEPVTVTGMFDECYVLVETGQASVEQTAPAVFLRLEDLPDDPDDDEPILTIGDTDYLVRERKRDSLGGLMLVLRLAPAGSS